MNTKTVLSQVAGKRVHVALPIRVSYGEARTGVEIACTYDIHPLGARVAGLRNVRHPGQIITVERSRNKALFRVLWIGDPESELRGQAALECLEPEKLPWLRELEVLEESYCAMDLKLPTAKVLTQANRRHAARFAVQGSADLQNMAGISGWCGELKEISEAGCRISVPTLLTPGMDLRVNLSIGNWEITLMGELRHVAASAGSGIKFHQVRRGDRPLLNSLLHQLEKVTQRNMESHCERPLASFRADDVASIDYID